MRKGCGYLKNKYTKNYFKSKLRDGWCVDVSCWKSDRRIYFIKGNNREPLYQYLSEKSIRNINYFVRCKQLGFTDMQAYTKAFKEKRGKVGIQDEKVS